MIQKIKTTILILLLFLCSFWGAFQLPYTQNLLREAISSLGQKLGINIAYTSCDFTLPFCFRVSDLEITTPQDESIVHCPNLTFTPLLLDLPWHNCTLLYLQAQDLSINLDRLPKTLKSDSNSSSSWSFSLLHFSLPSFTCFSTKLPNSPAEWSIVGRASSCTDTDQTYFDIQVTRDSPQAWPKKWSLQVTKTEDQISFEGGCALQGSIENFLFSSEDYLSFCGKGSLDLASKTLVKNASCQWAISSKALRQSLSWDIFLEHSLLGKGSLAYDGAGRLDGTIDAAQIQVRLQKPLLNNTFSSIKQQKLSFQGQFAASPLNDGTLRCEISLPKCSINDCAGAFSVSADIDSSKGIEKNVKAILSGDFSAQDHTIPILGILTASLGTERPSGDLTLTSSPLIAAFHFQKNEIEKSIIANIRCLNLSTFIKDCTQGEAELFAHITTTGGKAPCTFMTRVSNLSMYNSSLHDGSFSFSSPDILSTPWSVRTDLVGLSTKDLLITKAQSTLNYSPADRHLAIQEISVLGREGQLPFNLSATGFCELQKKALSCTIDSLEGTLDSESISLTHPIQINLANALLMNATASIRVGKESLITGHWQRLPNKNALAALQIDRFPLHLLSLALDQPLTIGTASGFLQYKKTDDDLFAKMHLDASKIRYGVIGAEGSGLAIGIDARIENEALTASICTAGIGIKDPLLFEGKIPITRTQTAPFCRIDPKSPLQATARGAISLTEFLTTWIPQQVHIEGMILGDLSISGSLTNPKVLGPICLRKGRIEIPTTAQVLNNIEMDGHVSGNTLLVETIRADDEKEGSVGGHGSVGFNEEGQFAWKADLTSSNMEVVSLTYAKANADGKIHLQGDSSSLEISGNPLAQSAVVDLAARFPNSIPEMKITYKDEQKIYKAPYVVTLHLGVDGQNGLLIRGKGLSSIWKGNVHIDGEAEALKMRGLLRCVEGSFMLGSKELCITEGVVGLHGNLFSDSKLHIIASIQLPDVVASVSLTGSLASPKLSIQSTPMKPDHEILSLILFNKEYSDISTFESLQLAQTALQLKQSTSPFDFIDRMKQSLGIDVLDVNTSNLQTTSQNNGALDPSDLDSQAQNDVSLRVGKYVSEGVAVVVSKDVTSDTNRLGIEAQIAKEVTAAAEIGDDESGVVSLKWKKDY